MSYVNELNKFTPGTSGFILVGDRWGTWWVPGIIWGRVCNHRRAIDLKGNHWFLDVGHQFACEPGWYGKRSNSYSLCKI